MGSNAADLGDGPPPGTGPLEAAPPHGWRAQTARGCGVVVVVALAAFGPYLSERVGIRTEQVALFAAVVIALPALLSVTRYSASMVGVLSCLIGVFAIGAVASFLRAPINDPNIVRGSVLAGLDNNLIPIAAVLLTAHWLSTGRAREQIFRAVAQVVVSMMLVNTLVALVSIRVNLTGILSHFYQATSSITYTNSVAIRAAVQGRYTGLFDQPAQAGIMYSLALFFAVYLWGGRRKDKPAMFAVLGSLLLVGGFLTVSKNFIIIGFPLAGLLLVRQSQGRDRRVRYAVGVPVVLTVALYLTGLLARFPGTRQLEGFLHPSTSGSLTGQLTAGRLGSDSTLSTAFHLITSNAALGGFGFGGLSLPYDDMWVAVGATAGYLGIGLYVAMTLLLVSRCFRLRHKDPTQGLMLCILALVVGAGIGFPILTGNRISTLLWIVLTTLFLSDEPWGAEASPTGSVSVTPRHEDATTLRTTAFATLGRTFPLSVRSLGRRRDVPDGYWTGEAFDWSWSD
jgi:hypothetical protein